MVKGSKHTEETKKKISLTRIPYKGNKHPSWKGGKIIVDGYIYVWNKKHPYSTKDGYVCEHRLVLEKKLGRYLLKTEAVHHINGIKTDNRIENLVVCISNGKHTAQYHDISKFRERDILGRFV